MSLLRYSNYVTYSERFKTAARSFVGGDIIAILLRQSMRLKALRQQASFRLRQAQLATIDEPMSNPVAFLAGIPITVVQQEAYNYQSDMTRHPVESGAVVSDHVILQPFSVDISFEVSNWEAGTAQYAMELLEALWLLREPVELLTWYKKIPNMVMINFQGSNSVPEWGKLSGRARFQQIGLGLLETTAYSSRKVAHKTGTGGPDVTKGAEEAEAGGELKPRQSVLLKGKKAIFKDSNQ